MLDNGNLLTDRIASFFMLKHLQHRHIKTVLLKHITRHYTAPGCIVTLCARLQTTGLTVHSIDWRLATGVDCAMVYGSEPSQNCVVRVYNGLDPYRNMNKNY